MKDYLSIGEVAKAKDVSIQALRYYDREGILVPSYVANSNYRYYKAEQLKELDLIKFALRIGLELKNLVPLFKSNDMDIYEKVLNLAKNNIANEIEDLKKIKKNLDIMTDEIDRTRDIKSNEGAYYKVIAERKVAVMPKVDSEDYYTQYQDNMLFNPPDTYGIFKECGYICEYNFGKFRPTNAYIILDDAHMKDKDIVTLPAGKYLCCHYNKDNKEEVLASVFDELAKRDATPKMAIEMQLADRIVGTDSSSYELQIII